MNTSPYVYEALAAAHQSDLRRAAAHSRLTRMLKARSRAERRAARAERRAARTAAAAVAQPVEIRSDRRSDDAGTMSSPAA